MRQVLVKTIVDEVVIKAFVKAKGFEAGGFEVRGFEAGGLDFGGFKALACEKVDVMHHLGGCPEGPRP